MHHLSLPASSINLSLTYQFLPPLSDEDYAALKKDIASRGVMVPVEYDQDGEILDGHHRVRACGELGLTDWPKVTRTFETEAERRTHARQLNIARRHLSAAQRRDLIADELKEQPMRSNRQVAAGLKVSDHTVAAVRSDLEATAQIAQLTQTTGADGKIRKIRQNKVGIEPSAYRLLSKSMLNNDLYIANLKNLPPEEQREKVEKDIAAQQKRQERSAKKKARIAAAALEDVEERQFAALMSAWNKAGPDVRQRFREEIDKPVMDAAAACDDIPDFLRRGAA